MHHRVHRRNFLGSQLEFTFDDAERKDWSNVPHFVHPRKGDRIGEFNIECSRSRPDHRIRNAPPLNPASGTGANHVHSVMRVPGNDFGEDWLRRHRREHPHG